MKSLPRAVLDTNVVLSALVFGGARTAVLRTAWRRSRLTPLVSRETATELIRALAYPKFRLTAAEQEELLGDYLPWCEVVQMPARRPRTPPCRDPADVDFLVLALAGKAAWLVSGDKDLLALEGRFSVPILPPDAFMARLSL